MNVEVPVTQEHFDKGHRCDGNKCPIALSVFDALPDKKTIILEVMDTYVSLTRCNDVDVTDVELPENVQEFITRFDTNRINSFEPFSFNLVVPDELCN